MASRCTGDSLRSDRHWHPDDRINRIRSHVAVHGRYPEDDRRGEQGACTVAVRCQEVQINQTTCTFDSPHIKRSNSNVTLKTCHVNQIRPDVIVSDVSSSPMDGFTFLEKIKADKRYRTIPAIFAAGYWSLHLPLYLKGAFAVFEKPVGIAALMDSVNRAMRPYPTS